MIHFILNVGGKVGMAMGGFTGFALNDFWLSWEAFMKVSQNEVNEMVFYSSILKLNVDGTV